MVYTHWLNDHGGIEADLTVTRIAEDEFWVISGGAQTVKDLHWLKSHIGDDEFCCVSDITNAWAMLGVMGPDSRALLGDAVDHDFSTANFPFGDFHALELGMSRAYAGRVSYVGELGWELYVPVDQARHAFDYLWEKGRGHGLSLAGMHALNSCRIEKKFVHYGHDVADHDTPLECGMSFVCALDKDIPFIGRDVILQQKESRSFMRKRLVQFLLQDPEPVFWHHEPILRNGEIVGHLTSGDYGHTLGGAVGHVAGERIPATASLTALYDPKAERMRG